MKYIQYAQDTSCWHLIFLSAGPDAVGSEHNYDVTFCDGLWRNGRDEGTTILSETPIEGLTKIICPGCIKEILRLYLSEPPKEIISEGWYRHWQEMPRTEQLKYVSVAEDFMGWSEAL